MTSASKNEAIKEEHDIINELKSDMLLVKLKLNGKKYARGFFLHEHEGFITYRKSYKLFGKPRIYHISTINEIRPGFNVGGLGQFIRKRRLKNTDEDQVFTITYDNHRRHVRLVAPNKNIRDAWMNGLQQLMDKHSQKSQRHFIKEENWILNYFRAADKDRSNTLSKRECKKLLADNLNVKVPDDIFEKLFQAADKSQEGLLSPEEFISFFHLLTQRKDIYQIMQKYTTNGSTQPMDKIHMNANELLSFLKTVQHQRVTINTEENNGENKLVFKRVEKVEDAKELIHEFELDDEFKRKDLISLDGFRNMLLSRDFEIAKPSHACRIYQNMKRPLCDYYINTSHNTYLFDSQLSGNSSPEAYNRALSFGCRAVELDCYDGNDGKPIVYHALTLVRPCTFESIIHCIEPNLFKTSPYPVILNIENHCSDEQQKEMTRILQEVLGDKIISSPLANEDNTALPSPDDLKYKVIIRSKKNTKTKKNNEVTPDDEENADIDPVSDKDPSGLIINLENVSFRDNQYAKEHYSPWHSSSLVESRFEKLTRDDPNSLIFQTAWRILRTYPGGLRQDSSNPDPITAWNYGIQMAALNFQNVDDIMPLCHGKFLDNGGCGYVLKPSYLIQAEETGYNPTDSELGLDIPQKLTLTIISAQFLMRPAGDTSDIPDPYVTVSVCGLPFDQQTSKTKVVENNGFDPIWNETFTFRIKYPNMALIYFGVHDYDAFSRDDKLAHFCLPLMMMQTGYRHIHLRSKDNNPTHSTLFVHVDIQLDDDGVTRTRL